MSDEIKIHIPQLNANDTEVYLGAFQIQNGTRIQNGELIAEIETTKGIEELLSPSDGYFYAVANESQTYNVGDCVAIISREIRNPIEVVQSQQPKQIEPLGVTLTAKARALVNDFGIDENDLPKGILLKEKDVIAYAKKMKIESGSGTELSARFEKAMQFAKTCNNPIIIVGAGTTAKITIETILVNNDYQIVGIVDSNAHEYDKVLGVPVIGYDDEETLGKIYYAGITKACNSVLSFYNLKIRESVYKKLKHIGFELPVIVHSKAFVENSATLGEGVFVHANVYIGTECKIGCNSFINTCAVISHDCIIGSTVFCAPNSVIAGMVSVGDYCVIGMCTTILSGVKIGNNVFLANGTNVISNFSDNAKLYNQH